MKHILQKWGDEVIALPPPPKKKKKWKYQDILATPKTKKNTFCEEKMLETETV